MKIGTLINGNGVNEILNEKGNMIESGQGFGEKEILKETVK